LRERRKKKNHVESSISTLRFQEGRSYKLEGGWEKKTWRGRREEKRERIRENEIFWDKYQINILLCENTKLPLPQTCYIRL
jgi:hypothetical protein